LLLSTTPEAKAYHSIEPLTFRFTPDRNQHQAYEHSRTSTMTSTTKTFPIPTALPDTCNERSITTFSTTGLNGTVCAISYRPAFLDITPCCRSAVRVEYNCTQICEVGPDDSGTRAFRRCIDDLNNGTFLTSLCVPVNNTGSGDQDETGGGESGREVLRI
jgi:hypothetical protein